MLSRLFILRTGEECDTERRRHSRRLRIGSCSLPENLYRWPHCTMQQQLGAPCKFIWFAWIQMHSCLVLTLRRQRIAHRFIDIASKSMEFCGVFFNQQVMHMFTCPL